VTGEDHVMKSKTICTAHQILFVLSNQEKCDARGT